MIDDTLFNEIKAKAEELALMNIASAPLLDFLIDAIDQQRKDMALLCEYWECHDAPHDEDCATQSYDPYCTCHVSDRELAAVKALRARYGNANQ